MSLPRDILDQLLSGYMDDALSNDERARVEQLLRDDPAVARELQELRNLRDTLREIHQADLKLKLGANFADRVLKATVDQATAEGLGEDHPVMLLTEQPSTVVPQRSIPVAKIAGVIATLAASIIVAIAVLRPPAEDPQQGGGLAQNDPPVVDPVGPVDVVPPEKVIEQQAPIGTAPVEQLANNDTPADVPAPADIPDAVEMPSKGTHQVGTEDTIPIPDLNRNKLNPTLLARLPVMVINVRQTEQGRASNAVGAAMVSAGLQPADEKRINDKIVGFSKDLTEQDQSVSVLYVHDSIKKIDNLITALYADVDGLDYVASTLVMDAPIMRVVDELQKLDPTTVRHGATWQLTDDEGNSLQMLAQELGSRKFSDRRGAAPPVPEKRSQGPDAKYPIFVLVR